MICSACGHTNRETARFCEACGARLELGCPGCGAALRAGARFCDGCGRAVGSNAAAPASGRVREGASPVSSGADRLASSSRGPLSYTPRHLIQRVLSEGRALRGERKEITVLFVDVQGSTELAGSLDPEAFHLVMDGAFQLMLDAVHQWEGTVNQFTGDGIMALFGAPIAHEDHARRALAAALEIQRSLAEYATRLRRDRGLSFQARFGLNSGSVVVGAIGDDLRMDYTAQGFTTHLAARMQQAADPGTILVAAPTYRLAEGYFRFSALGPLRVRGVDEPVEAYRLEGEGRVVSRLEASLRRGASPFRGREVELRALAEAWDRARQGRGEAICLIGEPGIGKSRLAYEFQRSLGVAERVEGVALAHARGAAYFVFRQLLRQLAGVPADADLAASRDLLHRHLWDLSPGMVRHVPAILSVLGSSADAPVGVPEPDERRDRLRHAVIEWIRSECERASRVFLVEDLQWLDPSSEELLGHLAVEARSLSCLLLMTSRLATGGRPLELARIQEITLKALSSEDIEVLVDAQLDPYPASPRLRRVIAARSEGNPFYVEELVRAFRDDGHLVMDHGTSDLRDGAERLIPATISALIASRVDRLPASTRELLADAAVLGMRFPLAHLRAMAESTRFDEDLTLVEQRGLLDRRGEGGAAGLTFRHVLTHEVVYRGLLQADRQGRHRRVAETLEQLYRGRTEEVCDQLGHQWVQSDRRARAFPHLLAAADATMGLGANREAIGHLEVALILTREDPTMAPPEQIAALRLKLAGLHFILGER